MNKVLSLFDGISCARISLERAGISVGAYYASEIDKYAIRVSQKNYPDIKHIGDVQNIIAHTEPFDLLIGGSPCQDLSIAKKGRKGLDGERSSLFWEYVRILKENTPQYFILENVASMSKESKEVISKALGVEPVMINASLVSAQNRKRLFWVGKLVGDKYEQVNIPQPQDKNIFLKDILESGEADRLKSYCIDANYYKGGNMKSYKDKGRRQLIFLGGGRGAKTGLYRIEKEPHGTALDYYNDTIVPNGKAKVLGTNPQSVTAVAGQLVNDNSLIRKLTPIECERLQGLPDNYTEGISNTQRYKCLGNAFNVDVMTHILKHLKL